MQLQILSTEALRRSLEIRDLTDPSLGRHAIQLVAERAIEALRHDWRCQVILERSHPIVSVADNYDRLHYPPGGAARDARYTRYVSSTEVLRTQTSAMIPPLLRRLAQQPPEDVLLTCPGVVYRRDAIDRLHTGEPHQLDLWRLRRAPPLELADLDRMIELVAAAVAPGCPVRTLPAIHPYTTNGLQVDVGVDGTWIEIGECGLAHPLVLREAGIPAAWTGLAMGLGLDRLVLIAKGMDDIRLLRSEDPRIAAQMADLMPYRPVSCYPPIRRDLSVAVAPEVDAEILGDRVRQALGQRASDVEAIQVLSETPGDALPAAARDRIGLTAGQKNVLLRLILRPLERTLTDAEANQLRDEVYAAIHEGSRHQWASRPSE